MTLSNSDVEISLIFQMGTLGISFLMGPEKTCRTIAFGGKIISSIIPILAQEYLLKFEVSLLNSFVLPLDRWSLLSGGGGCSLHHFNVYCRSRLACGGLFFLSFDVSIVFLFQQVIFYLFHSSKSDWPSFSFTTCFTTMTNNGLHFSSFLIHF